MLALAVLLLFVVLLLLGIGHANLVGSTAATNNWIKTAGWIGIVLAAVAWYIVLAALVHATFGRELLPTFPLNR